MPADLHPEALDRLLDVVVRSSETCQFVVTTHSAHVVQRLGAISGSRIYEVETEVPPESRLPQSRVSEVEATTTARLEVLRRLGHSVEHYYGAAGWIVFEESSAERICRQFLIPMFLPHLMRYRTIAADGVSDLSRRFTAFRDVYTFAHLDPPLDRACWVVADGDNPGKEAIEEMKRAFHSSADQFTIFPAEDFERYYPAEFTGRIDAVLGIEGKGDRRQAKHDVLTDVLAWLEEDPDRARTALAVSASEAVHVLGELVAGSASLD